MLVLTRSLGERIMIGEDICVTIIELRNGGVRIGISAPEDVSIHREEVYDRIRHGQDEKRVGTSGG